MHEALVRAATREAVSLLGLTTCLRNDHQLDGLTELLAVLLAGDAVLQGNQTLVAFLHDLLRDLVLHGRRRGAGANRVLEGERGGEAGLLNNLQGVLEVLLGLAGEAHNNVGGNHGVRDALAHLLQNVQELLGAVGTAHILKHLVGAGLQRHVQHGHDVRGFGHRVDYVVGKHGRVRGGEAHALQALNLTAGAQ